MGPFAASRGADRNGQATKPALGSAHIPDNDLGFEQPVDFGGSDEAARDSRQSSAGAPPIVIAADAGAL
jgi:hypothetical protein